MSTEIRESENAALIETLERLSGHEVAYTTHPGASGNSVPYLVLPEGKRIESLKHIVDQYAPAPDRIIGTAQLRDEASFIAHVNEMKRDTTRIFANPDATAPALTAVYDYHAVLSERTAAPAFCQHRAHWPLALSKEWQTWNGQAGKAMSAQEFAEFLERHVPDVYWGDTHSEYTKLLISTLELKLAAPSALIALSRNLAVNVDVAVRQAQTLSSGEINMTYVEQHKDGEGQPLRVPNAFLIAVPVILGGPVYQILARLSYRLRDSKVSWFYTLHRTDIVFDAAVREICTRVATETERPVFLGAPEK